MPGYAITICKSQGQTLDNVVVWFDTNNLGQGAAYVALSHVKSLKSIKFLTPANVSLSSSDTINIEKFVSINIAVIILMIEHSSIAFFRNVSYFLLYYDVTKNVISQIPTEMRNNLTNKQQKIHQFAFLLFLDVI